jgi:hypothetical protein
MMLPTKNYTTKDRNLIFGKGGDANVKLCIQHFLSPGLSPTPLGNLSKILQKKNNRINLNFELALNNSVIMLPTKNYVIRPKTKSAIALTKIILKICTFSQCEVVHSTFFIPGAQPHPTGESV